MAAGIPESRRNQAKFDEPDYLRDFQTQPIGHVTVGGGTFTQGFLYLGALTAANVALWSLWPSAGGAASGAAGGAASGAAGGAAGGAAAGGGAVAGGAAAGVAASSAFSIGQWLALGLAGIGAALNIIGNIKAGNAAKELGEFNARMAEMRATDALLRGAEEEQRFRMGVRTLIGSQIAGFAGQNVDIGVGSPRDVVADTAFLAELDAATIIANAKREAWGFRVEAENFRRGGEIAQSSSRWSAASTALTAGSSLLRARYGWGSGN